MMHVKAASFPPYQLLDRDYVAEAEGKLRKLERLYHVGQEHAWDGKQVLADLIKEHGGPQMDDATKQAAARIFSIILWGELAAWNIAADLALRLPDTEAKMAATGQAFDEARHFYVMRDYLLALGITVPPLDGFSLKILRDLLDTDDVVHKLIGMQLLVENIALTLFRMVGQTTADPVLRGLMPLFERDEARHVGLGVLYLPKILPTLSRRQLGRLLSYQKMTLLMISGQGFRLHEDFARLGINHRELAESSFRHQGDVVEQIRALHQGALPEAVRRGVLEWSPEFMKREMDFLYPHNEATISPLHRRARQGLLRGLDLIEAGLRLAA